MKLLIREFMIVFGYVPSRRLGRSLGVNNIPYKYCTYSCVYCQLGRTENKIIERRSFYSVDEIITKVRKKICELGKSNIDYITIVPDGEPTLDINLGLEIRKLKEMGKVAVITNSSLLFMEDVRDDLKEADLVSIKVDTFFEPTWKRINRPHKNLILNKILFGILDFSKEYDGKLISETMVLEGFNDSKGEILKIAKFLAKLKIESAYLSVPVRPPAENVRGPSYSKILKFKGILEKYVNCELLVDLEKGRFAIGSLEDIIAITSVHPLREDIMNEYLKKLGLKIEEVKDKFDIIEYGDQKYYRRKV